MNKDAEIKRQKLIQKEQAYDKECERRDLVGKPIHWQVKKLDPDSEAKLKAAKLAEPDELDDLDDPKKIRCQNFSVSQLQQLTSFQYENVPRCYIENTSKEELVLEHVLEYNR